MTFYDPNGNNNTQSNPIYVVPGDSAVQHTAIPAGHTANTVIKGSAGTYYGMLITSVGVGVPQVFDNATTNSGDIIDTQAASASIGLDHFFEDGIECSNGIVVSGGATMPAMTIYWT